MAHILQKVTVVLFTLTLLVVTGAAQRRPFSHKYHLTQVSSCQGCHTNAETSEKASDNLLPFNSECVTCHDEVHIKEPRRTTVTQFSHAFHVPMNPGPLIAAAIKSKTWLGTAAQMPASVNTNNACIACHHDIDSSEEITEKTGLAHYPRMADCLVCHSQIKPPDSCKQCHDPATEFRPADHTPEWVDAHSNPGRITDKAVCQTCHGRKFTCKGCH